MEKRCFLGVFLIGVGIGIALGVIMQLYWIYMVLFCIVSGVFLIR